MVQSSPKKHSLSLWWLRCFVTQHSLIPDLHAHVAGTTERYHVSYKLSFEVVSERKRRWVVPVKAAWILFLCALDAPRPRARRCVSHRFVLLNKTVQCGHLSPLYDIFLSPSLMWNTGRGNGSSGDVKQERGALWIAFCLYLSLSAHTVYLLLCMSKTDYCTVRLFPCGWSRKGNGMLYSQLEK